MFIELQAEESTDVRHLGPHPIIIRLAQHWSHGSFVGCKAGQHKSQPPEGVRWGTILAKALLQDQSRPVQVNHPLNAIAILASRIPDSMSRSKSRCGTAEADAAS